MASAIRSVFWRRIDRPGAEYFTLSATDSGWRLAGTVLLLLEERPHRIEYVIECGNDWKTRTVETAIEAAGESRSLRIAADEKRRWRLPDRELEAVRGAIDVDLSFSPSTNTLPIRRLDLAVGESRDVVAAWVLVPDLDVRLLPQRYTRLSESRYRYESRGGSFVAEIEVDELGLVKDYPGIWKREGSG
ncbi:MAG: putative glycolipid-binding domain-containing protein [Acidobacteriota bacterium]